LNIPFVFFYTEELGKDYTLEQYQQRVTLVPFSRNKVIAAGGKIVDAKSSDSDDE